MRSHIFRERRGLFKKLKKFTNGVYYFIQISAIPAAILASQGESKPPLPFFEGVSDIY